MAVSGVRSSWETEEMKSFFIFSAAPSSAAISLIDSHSAPISSFLSFLTRTSKLPCAIFSAVAFSSRIGFTIERTKYRPESVTSAMIRMPMPTRHSTTKVICRSARSIETTYRTAPSTAPFAPRTTRVIAMTFSPLVSLPIQ